jgi:hypothetical protein
LRSDMMAPVYAVTACDSMERWPGS